MNNKSNTFVKQDPGKTAHRPLSAQPKEALKKSAAGEQLSKRNEEYRFAIEYYIFREGDNIIAYCPSLDISTSGKDYGDAVKNFYERFQIYVETCIEMGTLWDDLKDHGWKVTEKKLTPPSFSSLVRKPEVSKLLGGHINYEKVSAPMRIAAMA